MKKAFVFVVCGDSEHVDTLHFSLRALKKVSAIPVWVVTDRSRNAKHIDHPADFTVDIKTSTEYDNHQASIFLKTSLNRILPLDGETTYCYLDSDVIALDDRVDDVFEQYVEPISFSSDHCRIKEFSSSAVNCGCSDMLERVQTLIDAYALQFGHLEENKEVVDELYKIWSTIRERFPLESTKSAWYDQFVKDNPELRRKRNRLVQLTSPSLPIHKRIFNYLFRVFPNYRRSLKERKWTDLEGNVLIDESERFYTYMADNGFKYDSSFGRWRTKDGKLAEEIAQETFNGFFESHGLKYNEDDGSWYTMDGKVFLPNITSYIEEETNCWYDPVNDRWYDQNNNLVFSGSCDHLEQAILNDFGVLVEAKNWQHWNGGVFLFSEASHAFMDHWHRITLEAFALPYWKTRDQGTLIATAWKFGIQQHPLIPIEFNFIADINHPTMEHVGELSFRLEEKGRLIRPAFIHIYHNWGDAKWNVWKAVQNHLAGLSNRNHLSET